MSRMNTVRKSYEAALVKDPVPPPLEQFEVGEYRCRILRGLQSSLGGYRWQTWDKRFMVCFDSGTMSTLAGAKAEAEKSARGMIRDKREDGDRWDSCS